MWNIHLSSHWRDEESEHNLMKGENKEGIEGDVEDDGGEEEEEEEEEEDVIALP